ncbi:MAG: LytR/AlgR family response regulator transcription factor [Weeksellaceae bacterium]
MRTAILDDEPLAIELLKDYAERTPQLALAFAGSDAFSLLDKIEAGEIDLVFLDIQMPELNGIQFLKIVKDKCKVILTTAYTEYAIDGYDYNVVDYLLKPISYERFYKAVLKLEDFKPQHLSQPNQQYINHNYLFVKSGYKTMKIDLGEIIYVKSSSDYVEYYLTDQTKILSLDTIKHLKTKLEHNDFIQIHRSYLINLTHIKYTERNRVIMANELRLPIGENYKQDFFNKIQ